jgi:hypothetical protein
MGGPIRRTRTCWERSSGFGWRSSLATLNTTSRYSHLEYSIFPMIGGYQRAGLKSQGHDFLKSSKNMTLLSYSLVEISIMERYYSFHVQQKVYPN